MGSSMITWLDESLDFPSPDNALTLPNGLLAAGGDLSPARILNAYKQGIFPWYTEGEPILWWSPNPRMVLFPHELHIPKSLAKRMRRKDYEVRFNTAFRHVIQACAAPRREVSTTWITESMVEAYSMLHTMGFAHSIETWMNDRLIGGLYGVVIGKVFFGESMFTYYPDASKIAFVDWVQYLVKNGFKLIDCQMKTEHLARFGAREISRDQFIHQLDQLLGKEELVY